MFERLRDAGELPLVTQFVLASSLWTKSWGIVIAMVAIAAGLAAAEWTRSAAGADRWDRFKLQCSGAGPIVRDLTLSQFFHLFGMLLSNGVPLLRALDLAGEAINNRFLQSAIRAGHCQRHGWRHTCGCDHCLLRSAKRYRCGGCDRRTIQSPRQRPIEPK